MTDPKKDPSRRCLKPENWPAKDQHLWNEALRVGDILEGSGPAAHWRPDSQRETAKSYGRWLTFLIRRQLLKSDTLPGMRVSEQALRDYIAELQTQVASITVARRIRDLAGIIKVMDLDHMPAYLPRAVSALYSLASPSRNKWSKFVAPDKLYRLGLKLMKEAEEDACRRRDWSASKYRDGLIICILAARAPRRRNLVMIRIGVHLLRMEGCYALHYSGEEMKGGRASEKKLPAELTTFVDRYLDHWRSILLKGKVTDRLWISYLGRPMAEGAVYDKVRAVTLHELGIQFNLHSARHALATQVAITYPENVGIVTPLLDHADPRTAEEAYNLSDSLSATTDYQGAMQVLRRKIVGAK